MSSVDFTHGLGKDDAATVGSKSGSHSQGPSFLKGPAGQMTDDRGSPPRGGHSRTSPPAGLTTGSTGRQVQEQEQALAMERNK